MKFLQKTTEMQIYSIYKEWAYFSSYLLTYFLSDKDKNSEIPIWAVSVFRNYSKMSVLLQTKMKTKFVLIYILVIGGKQLQFNHTTSFTVFFTFYYSQK